MSKIRYSMVIPLDDIKRRKLDAYCKRHDTTMAKLVSDFVDSCIAEVEDDGKPAA